MFKLPLAAAAYFIISRIIILFAYAEYSSDVIHYFRIANRTLRDGLFVYKDLPWGYPPLSLISFYFPYYFSQEYETYRFFYQLTNVFCDFVVLIYLSKICLEVFNVDRKRVLQALLIYITFGFFHGHYMYDRVDMPIVMCFVMAIYYSCMGRHNIAILCGVMGVQWKLIPVVWLPVAIINKAYKMGWRHLAWSSIIALGAIVIPLVVYDYGLDWAMFNILKVHGDRGIQAESLFATPIMIWKLIETSYPIELKSSYGAVHLVGDGVSEFYLFLAKYLGWVNMAGFYLLFLIKLVRDKSKNSIPSGEVIPANIKIFFYYSMPIFLFLIFQRILSTTFIIWLIPITCIWWAVAERHRWVILITALSISALTYLGFDLGYGQYLNFSVYYGLVFLARNFLLFFYGVWFIRWGEQKGFLKLSGEYG